MYAKCKDGTQQHPVLTHRYGFLISSNKQPLVMADEALEVSSAYFTRLVKRDTILSYLKDLYAPDKQDQLMDPLSPFPQYNAAQLIGLRYAARDELTENDRRTLVSLSAAGGTVSPDRLPTELEWTFLGALQTGLMYVEAARIEKQQAHGFVSVGACYLLEGKAPGECPLAILSAVLPPDCEKNKRSRLVGKLEEILKERLPSTVHAVRESEPKLSTAHLLLIKERGRAPLPLIRRQVLPVFESAFIIKSFPKWREGLVLWLGLLAERLRGIVHEGTALNFTFVVADRSQILDSGLFDAVELRFDGPDATLVPWDVHGNEFDKAKTKGTVEAVLREIGKKNYSWFLDGKYALLWDSTFPRRSPSNLIRFRESSWDVFLNHVRLGKESRAKGVVRAMIYVSADGSGGIIADGKHLASFRKGQPWTIGLSRRAGDLEKHLEKHLGKWSMTPETLAATVRRVGDALLAISDDPHVGCLLVIFLKDSPPQFDSMGDPWKTANGRALLKMTLDELTSLMAMDGATCLYLEDEQPAVAFRRLIRVPDAGASGPRVREIHPDAASKLDGEGSRKWSAANAARREEVSVVMSVSQDGPIHIYQPDGGNRVTVQIIKGGGGV